MCSQHHHGLVTWIELMYHPKSVTRYQLITQMSICNLAIKILTPNDLQRSRAVSPLKIKIPSKNISDPTHHVTENNTPIHNILSNAPQLSVS
jgi:hypothetical protein